MSRADQFRQYAEEDLRWARRAATEKEKRVLLELARHRMQAAMWRESAVAYSPQSTGPCKAAWLGGLISPSCESTRRERRAWPEPRRIVLSPRLHLAFRSRSS